MAARVIRLDLQYDGTDFRGFAPQPGLRTIDGELRGALAKILGEDVRLIPGARTDAGVHAKGQVVSFSTDSRVPAQQLRGAVNALTGGDLRVSAVVDAKGGFDARRDAQSRSYEYCLWNAPEANVWERRWTLHVDDPLNLDAMERACEVLHGRHDFGAFYTHKSQDDLPKGTIRRVLDLGWERDLAQPELLRFHIKADAFLRHMVRAIVGSAILVGLDKLSETGLEGMLEKPERMAGGPTAPASGLTLMEVAY